MVCYWYYDKESSVKGLNKKLHINMNSPVTLHMPGIIKIKDSMYITETSIHASISDIFCDVRFEGLMTVEVFQISCHVVW